MLKMRAISILAFAALGAAGCKEKTTEPSTSATVQAKGSAEPAAPAVVAAKPVDVPAVSPLGFDASHVGPITSTTKFELDELKKLFPDAVVESRKEEAEGETQEVFIIKKGGAEVLRVAPGSNLVQVLDASFKDPRGVGLGSTYEDLTKAYPDLACDREKNPGGAHAEGGEAFDVVTCTTATTSGVSYLLDVASAKKPKKVAAAVAAAGRKITSIWVTLGAAQAKTADTKPVAASGPQVVTVDPTSGTAVATACRAEDVTFIVPTLGADDWKVTKKSKGVRDPKREFAERFHGPNAHAEKYTFATKQFDSEAHEATIEFTNKADGAKFVATINLMCND